MTASRVTEPEESATLVRFCALVPTYDNPATVRQVVERLRTRVDHVLVVDDGSGPAGQAAVAALGRDGLAHTVRRAVNGGKGAAVKTGLAAAQELGFTHALQVDADGQHALDDVPRLLAEARRRPDALVLGSPVFDDSAPAARQVGRRITTFWIHVECGGAIIDDAMCGFRVYPVAAALRARARGDAMDFDPEVAVRMVWDGVPVINVPTRVRYLEADEGGVSHFRLFRDNVLISWMHTRLMVEKVCRTLLPGLRRPTLGRVVAPALAAPAAPESAPEDVGGETASEAPGGR